jgi:hypothetical protein
VFIAETYALAGYLDWDKGLESDHDMVDAQLSIRNVDGVYGHARVIGWLCSGFVRGSVVLPKASKPGFTGRCLWQVEQCNWIGTSFAPFQSHPTEKN